MPRSSNYGASYPDGSIIAHNGDVVNEADPDSDAPRFEDTRPTTETDGKQTQDERGEDNAATTRRQTEDEQKSEDVKQSTETAADSGNDTGRDKSNVRAFKSATPSKSTTPKTGK